MGSVRGGGRVEVGGLRVSVGPCGGVCLCGVACFCGDGAFVLWSEMVVELLGSWGRTGGVLVV